MEAHCHNFWRYRNQHRFQPVSRNYGRREIPGYLPAYAVNPISKKYYKNGYKNKDHCIIEAIKAIQKNPNSGFRYHVKIDRTLYGGAHCFVVYFNFKIGTEAYQVSFHCFSNLWRFVNRKCVTRWKKKHSSKESVIKLAYHLFAT